MKFVFTLIILILFCVKELRLCITFNKIFGLYTNYYFANINIVIALITILFILLIFPIVLKGRLVLDKQTGIICYYVKLFNVFKVLHGYFELDKEGIIVHLTRKKAVLIRFSEILSIRKKFKPLKDYHLMRFNSCLDVGICDNNTLTIVTSFYAYSLEIIGDIITCIKPYFEFKNTINIYEYNDMFKLSINAHLVFNLLMILISAIKIILEKIIYAIKDRKQQN